jgi:H+/Cl- antiporter ClcA
MSARNGCDRTDPTARIQDVLGTLFNPTAAEAVLWIMAAGFFGGVVGYLAAVVASLFSQALARRDPLRWSQHVAIWAALLASLFFLDVWVR